MLKNAGIQNHTDASRVLIRTNCPRQVVRDFPLALYRHCGRKEKISISHPFIPFVDHSMRYPSGSGNRPEWQHSLPLSEAIRKDTRPKLRAVESLSTTLTSDVLRTFKGLLQTLLDL